MPLVANEPSWPLRPVPSCNVPPLMVVAPMYVLFAVKISVPGPLLIKRQAAQPGIIGDHARNGEGRAGGECQRLAALPLPLTSHMGADQVDGAPEVLIVPLECPYPQRGPELPLLITVAPLRLNAPM